MGIFGGDPGSGDYKTVPTDTSKLIDLFLSRAIRSYVIDPDGLKIEITFFPNGTCDVKTGDSSLRYSFIQK